MAESGIISIHGRTMIAPNGVEYVFADDGQVYRRLSGVKNKSTKYRQIGLGRNYYVTVHRVMCEMWHGPAPFEGAVVRHLDGDRQNNRPENLAWGTHKENSEDAAKHGTMPVGTDRYNSRLTDGDVHEIRAQRKRYGLWKELAVKYGVSPNTIADVWHGRTWNHV